MTFEEKGAYVELLMLQFNRGHMTSHMIAQTVGQLWVNIQDKFKIDDNGLFYNARLEIEIEKRKKFISSRFNNLEGKNQHSNKTGHIDGHMNGHMTSRMENENEIENVISKYNTTSFAKIQKISDKRKLHLSARIKENGLQAVLDVIEKADKSKFLHGNNKNNWTATFDWIINPSNFLKIMEGNYDNKIPVPEKLMMP